MSEPEEEDAVVSVYGDLLAEAWSRARGVTDTSESVHAYPEFRDDLVGFQREVLGQRPWEAPVLVMRKLIEMRRVALRSSRKTSKTHTGGSIVNGFIATGPSVVVTTAGTGRQIRELLWSEVRSQHARSQRPLPGRCGVTTLRVTADWYAIGFSTDDPENALGFHAGVKPPDDAAEALEQMTWGAAHSGRRLLILIDEAPGVDQSIYDAMVGSMSGDNTYVLVQGNPVIPSDSPHFFAQIHQPGSEFFRIHIGAIEPEPGEDEVGADACFHHVPEWLVDDAWLKAREHEWGRNSPLFRAHVMGLFANAGDEDMRVMPRATLEAAEAREASSEQGRHLGVDVARMGGDECVAALWVDGVKSAEHVWSGVGLMETADLIVTLGRRWDVPAGNTHIDIVGIGAGVVDRLRQMGFFVDGVDFGSKAKGDWKRLTGELAFRNRRAELHWVVRRAFEEGLGHLPRRWQRSWEQSQWARFLLRAEGSTGSVVQVEPKDDIRERYGRSPDHWDADLLAWARSTLRPTVRTVKRGRLGRW